MGPIFLQTRIYEFIHPPLECFTKICVYIYVVYLWTKGINVQKKIPLYRRKRFGRHSQVPFTNYAVDGASVGTLGMFHYAYSSLFKDKKCPKSFVIFLSRNNCAKLLEFRAKNTESLENFGSIFLNFFRELNLCTHGVKCGKISWAARIISKGSLSFAVCASNSILFFRQASRFIHYDIWSMIMRLCGNKLLTRASILGFCQNFKLFSRAFFLGFSIMPS